MSDEDIWDTAPHDLVWSEFKSRLTKALVAKGWNQSELARRATDVAPEGIVIGRDLISNYLNARKKTVPLPHHLSPVAHALGVEPKDLLPTTMGRQASKRFEVGAQPEFKGAGDGYYWVRVNQRLPIKDALEIMQIIHKGAT